MVVSKERQGLVMDIATVLNALNAKVRSLNARDTDDGRALVTVSLEVKRHGRAPGRYEPAGLHQRRQRGHAKRQQSRCA
jgi:hypothetical protein